MSTRIVERELSCCRSRVERFLNGYGYVLDSTKSEDEQLKDRKYTRQNKGHMLYRPVLRVTFEYISPKVTRLSVSFPRRWNLEVALFALWTSLGLGPVVAALYVLPRILGHVTFLEYRPWFLLASIGWCFYFVAWKGMVAAEALDQHWRELDKNLWEHLDLTGSTSHEVAAVCRSDLGFFRVAKWISLCITVIGGALIVASAVLPSMESALDRGWGGDSVFRRIVMMDTLRPAGPIFGSILFFCGGSFWVLAGWVTCSYALPHRYHWKVRFGSSYLLWCMIVALPGFLFIWRIMQNLIWGVCASSSHDFTGTLKGFIKLGQMFAAFVVLLPQCIGIAGLLRMLPETKGIEAGEDYYTPPSTCYETLTEERIGKEAQCLMRQYKRWVWGAFLLFSTFCYFAAIYLAITMVESIAAILGASWALARAWHWPLVVPVEGMGAAVQSLVLTCLMGFPLATTSLGALYSRLRLSQRLKLGRELAEGSENLDLPVEPLEHLKQELAADALEVALVPLSDINLQLDRIAIFKRHYLLSVSIGAWKKLPNEEVESLLWHECGHASLLRRKWWRELVSLLAPWAPRFLDLAEDLYERELQADLYAVRKMGDARPLLSALRRIKEEKKSISSGKQPRRKGSLGAWVSWNAVKMIWSLGWTGYLHPDVDQRLHWLEVSRDQFSRTAKPLG